MIHLQGQLVVGVLESLELIVVVVELCHGDLRVHGPPKRNDLDSVHEGRHQQDADEEDVVVELMDQKLAVHDRDEVKHFANDCPIKGEQRIDLPRALIVASNRKVSRFW